ncbi:hypothetical protein Kpho02_41400 [Kitasatospora phosalacinea]|uniref:Uncharacterized protein n=1 Tax=Kitasatospora phosalacinea TaxID=2065 RepID=A0A9W6QB92_9ACTN|nr:hypothetical protein [Kitasatospora phosalacinea]GLW71841.1 hypothetical protein Kpho02_41400 [Kitasatospora phosalacinea]
MGMFKDAPPSEHPDFTQLRFMAAGTPSWWKRNRHKALGVAGLLAGFWLANHYGTAAPAASCTPTATTTTPAPQGAAVAR